jgi:hypothetical protein
MARLFADIGAVHLLTKEKKIISQIVGTIFKTIDSKSKYGFNYSRKF